MYGSFLIHFYASTSLYYMILNDILFHRKDLIKIKQFATKLIIFILMEIDLSEASIGFHLYESILSIRNVKFKLSRFC